MKILLVSEPGVDGVFRHVETIARGYMKRGHDVLLAYSSRRDSDRLYTLIEQIAAAGGESLDLRTGNRPGPADLGALRSLVRFIRRTEPDILHAHSSKAGMLARLSRLCGVSTPVLYTPHAYYKMGTGDRRPMTLAILAAERALAYIGSTVNLGATETEYAHAVVGVPRQRRRIVHNGIDCELFAPPSPAEKRAAREHFHLPPDAMILGTVGRFSYQKDPATLYGAFKRALADFPNLVLAHLGKGELWPETERYIQAHGFAERVIRVDYAPEPSGFYRALDGFILTSRYEGMSYAILEALATNLPIILTPAPGNSDFAAFGLSHVHWGETGVAESVAGAIGEWQRRASQTPNHREVALKLFTEDRCVEGLLQCYADALEQ